MTEHVVAIVGAENVEAPSGFVPRSASLSQIYVDGKLVHRSRLTSGGANGMSEVDAFATAQQRGLATVVQALGMLAERAVLQGSAPLARSIARLLLPLTLEPEPAEAMPPGAIKPAQAAVRGLISPTESFADSSSNDG